MIPTLSLGPFDAPDFEIMPGDLYPLVAMLIEHSGPLTPDEIDSLNSLFLLDTLYLREKSRSVFQKLQVICEAVLSGALTRYDLSGGAQAELAEFLERNAGPGVVTPGMKVAARRFLDFLKANPDDWPLR
ncbi:hypothetical protein [Brevundimonas sp. FT23028]|uniref:hypothetical protein n=1 Tax=Brevundimonas sp. FT23028 TaxID=3393748 RepID=UPI003B589929